MSKRKTVVIEKDGVRAEADQNTFKGLAKRGWTVVDDGDKDAQAAQQEEQKQAEELEQQEQQLFGTNDEE